MRLLMADIAVLLILYKGIELLNDGLPCLALGCRAHVGLSLAPSGLLARAASRCRGFVAATPARAKRSRSRSRRPKAKGGGRSGLRPLVRTLRLTCFFSLLVWKGSHLPHVRTYTKTHGISKQLTEDLSHQLIFSSANPSHQT